MSFIRKCNSLTFMTTVAFIFLYMSSRLSKIGSVHTCYAPDGLFWLNLYLFKPEEQKPEGLILNLSAEHQSGCPKFDDSMIE